MNQTIRTVAVWVGIAILFASAALGQESRTFHPYTVAQVAQADPGDWHGLFLSHVEVTGYKVKIDGIYRYDAENPGHHWAEIHPVTRISEFL